MPITVQWADGGRGCILVGEGALTGPEVISGVEKRFADDEVTRNYLYSLSDYTRVTRSQMTSREVQQVAQIDMRMVPLLPDLVLAIVAPEDLMFGLSRMFKVHAEETGWRIGVFRTMAEAHAWIREQVQEVHGTDLELTFIPDP